MRDHKSLFSASNIPLLFIFYDFTSPENRKNECTCDTKGSIKYPKTNSDETNITGL